MPYTPHGPFRQLDLHWSMGITVTVQALQLIVMGLALMAEVACRDVIKAFGFMAMVTMTASQLSLMCKTFAGDCRRLLFVTAVAEGLPI